METINLNGLDRERLRQTADRWKSFDKTQLHSPVNFDGREPVAFDFSTKGPHFTNEMDYLFLDRFITRIEQLLERNRVAFGYGGYAETRQFYRADAFNESGSQGLRWRTNHIGLDVWGAAGTPIFAPLDGTLHSSHIDPTPGTYGPTIILEHDLGEGYRFYTLYGHLAEEDIMSIRARTRVQKGDRIAKFGKASENGGWPPHLHFQVILDMLGMVGDFPGVAYPEDTAIMLEICPDPTSFFGLDRL